MPIYPDNKMEDVDMKEWYSISVSSVQMPNRISWSADHKVSVITSSSLHIMEINPTPSLTSSDINLKRSVIRPSDDAPTGETGIDVNILQCELDMREFYSMVLDTKMSPKLIDAKKPEPKFAHCCWSPAGMFQEHRCMIASLTNLGCLKLYVPYFTSWLEITDVSNLWVNHCKLQWQHEDIPSDGPLKFVLLKKRVCMLKFNVMIWHNQIIKSEGKRFSLMVTISHDGTLAVWKIPQLEDLTTFSEDYKPTLINTFETNIYCATTLHWFWWSEEKFSIAIGNFEGFIKIATLVFDRVDVSLISIKDIWNFKDRMQVSCIKSLPASSLHPQDHRIVGVAKNDYFLVFLISENGVEASCHELVGNLTVTGMEIQNEESFLISTLPGYICSYSVEIKHSPEGPQLTLQHKVFKTNISWNDVSCFGIIKSPFSNLWALGTSTCKLYDHLVIRKPSQIVLTSIKDMPDPLDQIESTQLKPRHVWECLEIMRLSFIKHQEPPRLMYLHCPDDLEKLSTNQLQLELWRSRMVLAQVSAAADLRARQTETSAFVTLIEELILCRHACGYIRELIAKHCKEPLDERNLSSLGLLRSWLQIWWSQNTGRNSEQPESEIEKDNKIKSGMSDTSVVGMEFMEITENNEPSSSSSLNTDIDENAEQTKEHLDIDESSSSSECTSVSSFSGKTVLGQPNKRISPSFLKVELAATRDLVAEVLALPLVPDVPDKEICEFCEQEIQMDRDWRSSVCPANHRMSRCSICLRRCRRIPQQLCLVCPVVTCVGAGHQSHCIFCDSLLLLDEKFAVPSVFRTRQPAEPLKEDTEDTEDSAHKPESVAEDETMEFDSYDL